MPPPRHLIPARAWLLLLLAGVAGMLFYIDRQTLSVLKTTLKTELVRPGLVAIAGQPRRLLLEFDPAILAVKIEPVPIDDPSLHRSWGDQLWRVAFEYRHAQAAGEYELRFRADPAR